MREFKVWKPEHNRWVIITKDGGLFDVCKAANDKFVVNSSVLPTKEVHAELLEVATAFDRCMQSSIRMGYNTCTIRLD